MPECAPLGEVLVEEDPQSRLTSAATTSTGNDPSHTELTQSAAEYCSSRHDNNALQPCGTKNKIITMMSKHDKKRAGEFEDGGIRENALQRCSVGNLRARILGSTTPAKKIRPVLPPNCWNEVKTGGHELQLISPPTPTFVTEIGIAIQAIELKDELNTLPPEIAKLIAWLRVHPNCGFKGGVARAALKWSLGLRDEPWMVSELKGFNDIDMILWEGGMHRYGGTVDEVEEYFCDQERCKSPLVIEPVDIEIQASFVSYFEDRDITQNQVLVWSLPGERVMLLYVGVAGHDCLHGIIRPTMSSIRSPLNHNIIFDPETKQFICEASMVDRCISAFLKGRGVEYRFPPETLAYWRRHKLPIGRVFTLFKRQKPEHFLRAYNHLVAIGMLERQNDPNLWWGEVLATINDSAAKSGDRLSFGAQSIEGVGQWKRGKKLTRDERERLMDAECGKMGLRIDWAWRVPVESYVLPDWLPGVPEYLAEQKLRREQSNEVVVEVSRKQTPTSSVAALDQLDGQAQRPWRDGHMDYSLFDTSKYEPANYDLLSIWQTVQFVLSAITPFRLEYWCILLLSLVGSLVRIAALMYSPNVMYLIGGLCLSMLVSLLVNMWMVAWMPKVSAGVRAEFVANVMHRSGSFWSKKQRYPEMWSRFAGDSSALESTLMTALPNLVVGGSQIFIVNVYLSIASIGEGHTGIAFLLMSCMTYAVFIWGLGLALTPILRLEARRTRKYMGRVYGFAYALMERMRVLQETNVMHKDIAEYHNAILDAKLVSRVIGVLKGSFEPVFTTLRYCVPLFLSMMLAEAMAGSPDAIKSNVLLLLMSYCGTVNQTCTAWASLCVLSGALERFFVFFQPHRDCAEAMQVLRETSRSGGKNLGSSGGLTVRLSNVVFEYPSCKQKTALKLHGDHTLSSGVNVIAMPRGAGSSTLGRLLLKHWPCCPKMISVDGEGLETMDNLMLRQAITVVDHDIEEDGARVLDSLLLGVQDTNSKRVERVLSATGMDFCIAQFPQDIETQWWHTYATYHQCFVLHLCRAVLRDTPCVYIEDPYRHASTDVQRAQVRAAIGLLAQDPRRTIIITAPDAASCAAMLPKSCVGKLCVFDTLTV